MINQFLLFKTRKFLPLFIAQFLGALNDYLLKTSIVVMLAYGFLDSNGINAEILVSLAAAVFIVPFILFCALAGNITDKFDKAKVAQALKLAELLIVIIAIVSLYNESLFFGFLALFALGTQSAFFAPCKYSLPPQHLSHDELLGGNGLLSTGTYLAILAGTILGTVLAPLQHGKFLISFLLLAFSIAGLYASFRIPPAPSFNKEMKINWNMFSETWKIIRAAAKFPFGIFAAILAVSWFHLIAGTFHTQLPNYTKGTLGADPFVLSFFMILFSLGMAVGGLLNNRLLKSKVDIRYVPFAGIAICILTIDLYFLSQIFLASHDDRLLDFKGFLSEFNGLRIALDLFLIAFAGGLYIVPLRAFIQQRSDPSHCARIIAASAFCDASFVLFSVLVSMFLIGMGVKIETIFAMTGLATLGVAALVLKSKALHKPFERKITQEPT